MRTIDDAKNLSASFHVNHPSRRLNWIVRAADGLLDFKAIFWAVACATIIEVFKHFAHNRALRAVFVAFLVAAPVSLLGLLPVYISIQAGIIFGLISWIALLPVGLLVLYLLFDKVPRIIRLG